MAVRLLISVMDKDFEWRSEKLMFYFHMRIIIETADEDANQFIGMVTTSDTLCSLTYTSPGHDPVVRVTHAAAVL